MPGWFRFSNNNSNDDVIFQNVTTKKCRSDPKLVENYEYLRNCQSAVIAPSEGGECRRAVLTLPHQACKELNFGHWCNSLHTLIVIIKLIFIHKNNSFMLFRIIITKITSFIVSHHECMRNVIVLKEVTLDMIINTPK